MKGSLFLRLGFGAPNARQNDATSTSAVSVTSFKKLIKSIKSHAKRTLSYLKGTKLQCIVLLQDVTSP